MMKDRALRRHQVLKQKEKVSKLIIVVFQICPGQKSMNWKIMLEN